MASFLARMLTTAVIRLLFSILLSFTTANMLSSRSIHAVVGSTVRATEMETATFAAGCFWSVEVGEDV